MNILTRYGCLQSFADRVIRGRLDMPSRLSVTDGCRWRIRNRTNKRNELATRRSLPPPGGQRRFIQDTKGTTAFNRATRRHFAWTPACAANTAVRPDIQQFSARVVVRSTRTPHILSFANIRSPGPPVDSWGQSTTGSRMLNALLLLLRSIVLTSGRSRSSTRAT